MKELMIGLFAAGSLGSLSALASDRHMSVEVTNLTNGIYFTPLLVSAHNAHTHMFHAGTAASASLQAMAEGGDLSGLLTDVGGADADTSENPAAGLLAPGQTTILRFDNLFM